MKAYRSLSITFGLINVPVQIAPAFTTDKVSGNYICSEHHEKLSLLNNCPSCGTKAKRVLGYPVGDGFIVPSEADLAALKSLSDKAIHLDGFTTVESIDPLWFEKSYAMWPKAGADEGFGLLTAAFKDTGIAGVGTAVLDKSEVPVVIRYSSTVDRLVLHTCHYGSELRLNEIQGLGQVAEVPAEMVNAAMPIITSALTTWDVSSHVDTYQEGLRNLLAGKKVTAPEQKSEAPQPDLIAALKASVEANKTKKSTTKKAVKV